jgi:alpha-amylase
MGVLLQALYFRNKSPNAVPSPVDGDATIPFWWDHLAAQANAFRKAGFTAVWLPPPFKGASGGFSSGYDPFDDYDLGSKNQKGTVPTRHGTRDVLQRCAAVLRANGLDIYVDIVNHHRDGDNQPFIFRYVNFAGAANKGRFPKNPKDFHPNVPNDPNTFDNTDAFGRRLAPITGEGQHVFNGLLAAGDWLTKALDLQGYRIDDAKGTSTDFLTPFLNHGAMAGKFAVSEFFDTDFNKISTWQNMTQHRSSVFDFPLHFTLRQVCDFPDSFFMGNLDHAGFVGVDPLGSVTFVENADTDQNVKGEAIIANKAMAYAYILTSEGYPCVFYKDYSTDPGCYGLKPVIDPLLWIHENLATGGTLQRWKDNGVFAFERLGGPRLLVGLNKDAGQQRTITVATTFGPHAELDEFTGHGHPVRTDGAGNATITIPRNQNGGGYVCYSHPRPKTPFPVHEIETTQEFAGAEDLDIGPATVDGFSTACRVWVKSGKNVRASLFFDAAHWTPATSIRLELLDPNGQTFKFGTYHASTPQGTAIEAGAQQTGFYTFRIHAFQTPQTNARPSFSLKVSYTASQTL